jgi:Zinc finger, C3HC4 type (RING finger)
MQPVPFPVPALYHVTLPEGAIFRSGIELSSSQIGHAPMGALLTVTGRVYSENPMDQCIERLRQAGDGGWVSVRLNRPPPEDRLVVEMVDIDGSFEPFYPGIFHLDAQHRIRDKQPQDGGRQPHKTSRVTPEISSIDENERCSSSSFGSLEAATCRKAQPSCTYSASLSSKQRSRMPDDRCLICLSEERTSTIVHGETGHIACCLVCARILKARGDPCPVCRLPIDVVIQQFWA